MSKIHGQNPQFDAAFDDRLKTLIDQVGSPYAGDTSEAEQELDKVIAEHGQAVIAQHVAQVIAPQVPGASESFERAVERLGRRAIDHTIGAQSTAAAAAETTAAPTTALGAKARRQKSAEKVVENAQSRAAAEPAGKAARGATKKERLAEAELRVDAAVVAFDRAKEAVGAAQQAADAAVAAYQADPTTLTRRKTSEVKKTKRALDDAQAELAAADRAHAEALGALQELRATKSSKKKAPGPAGGAANEDWLAQGQALLKTAADAEGYEDKAQAIAALRTFAAAQPDGKNKKAFLQHVDGLERSLMDLQLAFDKLGVTDVDRVVEYRFTGNPGGLTADQQAVIDEVFAPGSNARGAELLAQLDPTRRDKIKNLQSELLGKLERYPEPLRGVLRKFLGQAPKTPEERSAFAQELTAAYSAAARQSIGKPIDLNTLLARIGDMPPAMQTPARDFVMGQYKLDMKIQADCNAISGLLNSSMPIEMLVLLVMSLFHDMKDEEVRQKIREANFAQQQDRFQKNVQLDLKRLKDKDHASKVGAAGETGEPLTSYEQSRLVELEKWSTFDSSQFGFELKSSDVLMQELQMLMQQVGSSRVDLQACKLEYSIVSPK